MRAHAKSYEAKSVYRAAATAEEWNAAYAAATYAALSGPCKRDQIAAGKRARTFAIAAGLFKARTAPFDRLAQSILVEARAVGVDATRGCYTECRETLQREAGAQGVIVVEDGSTEISSSLEAASDKIMEAIDAELHDGRSVEDCMQLLEEVIDRCGIRLADLGLDDLKAGGRTIKAGVR